EKHIRPNSRDGRNEDRSVFGFQANAYSRRAGVDDDGTIRAIVESETDQNGPVVNTRFGGPHAGVCQFVFVDGSVKALRKDLPPGTYTNNRIIPGVLHLLAVRNDGQPLSSNDF